MEAAAPILNPILLARNGDEQLTRELKTEASDLEIAEFAARAAGGSIEAFEELALRFEPRIYGFLCRHVGNAHDAQDLTQETFVRAWRAIQRFDPQRNFATWLFVIARRSAANHFRSRRAHDALDDSVADGGAIPGDQAACDDESHRLWRAANKLKSKFYEALWLRYGEDFSAAQTARVMGLTTLHVKVILHRARKELARHLKREDL
jgi:RNA polymerase sigma-70 factor (ECF subfamily)